MSQTERIARLTDAQVARMPEWVAKWLAIGLSTEPADWDRAEQGVRDCYVTAGLPAPLVILRMGSPYAAALGGAYAATLLSSQVRSQVESQVRSQIESQVRLQVGSQVWLQVRSQVWSQVRSIWSQCRGAQLWASWYAYISYLRDVCNWHNPTLAAFAHDEQIASSCGWTWWHDKVCAISDRPRTLRRDERGRLHCENDPALAYPDGWAVYAWHGIRVSADVIETPAAKITLDRVLAERNAEVARVLMRRAPATLWDDPRVIVADRDVDGAGQPRQLLQVMVAGQPLVIVRVKCPSTGGEYRLRVPPDVQTCSAAVAWTFRKDTKTYSPLVET